MSVRAVAVEIDIVYDDLDYMQGSAEEARGP